MTERPILFSGPMVRAIPDGRKTQTRRIVNAKRPPTVRKLLDTFLNVDWESRPFPYGRPGDRLWMRESGVISRLAGVLEKPGLFRHDIPTTPEIGHYWVEESIAPGASDNVAGCTRAAALLDLGAKASPSIHMPRWAPRITLEITCMRVERLHDISEDDAEAEDMFAGAYEYDYGEGTESARDSFQRLWDRLNAASGHRWNSNPSMWAINFKQIAAAQGTN